MSKTIAFFGASGGVGLAALQRAVEAGHTCIALCRTPSKLEAIFPNNPRNLIVTKGNAHDIDVVASCLVVPSDPTRLVDAVNFSIGGKMDMKTMAFDDPDVCKKGMGAILEALKRLRSDAGASGQPLLSIVSTTGISKAQRDVPLAFVPMYKFGLKTPHLDKEVMEAMVVESGERYVLVRPSLLKDKDENKEKGKPLCPIRVGIEDPKAGVVERKEVGYMISRDEVGRWMWENLLSRDLEPQYQNRAVGLTW